MQNIFLERPLEFKNLCDWAYIQYQDIKLKNPVLTEGEIARKIFAFEYKNSILTPTLIELAKKNIDNIDSIPDLIFTMINMEAEGGRDYRSLNILFIASMVYCTTKYLDNLGDITELNQIALILKLIRHEVNAKYSDPQKRNDMFNVISTSLISYGIYKNYDSNDQVVDLINMIINQVPLE